MNLRALLWVVVAVATPVQPGWSAPVTPGDRSQSSATPADPGALPGAVTVERIESLIRRGEKHREQGRNREAAHELEAALTAARNAGDPVLEALSGAALGGVYLANGDAVSAETLLQSSFVRAITLDLPGVAAVCANQLGNLNAGREGAEKADAWYSKGLQYAKQANDLSLAVAVRINIARLRGSTGGDSAAALVQLRAAYDLTPSIVASGERARRLLAIGYQAGKLKGLSQADGPVRAWLANAALRQAADLGRESGDARSLSMADGYLGALYESAGREQEAMLLTERAIHSARNIDASDLLLQWEWQRGRLFRSTGDTERALAAYRRAVQHIAAVRSDIPIIYSYGRSSFRETLEPVFLGLADLLLQQSRENADPEAVQALLTEARDTVESVKVAELDEFFRDPCSVATRAAVDLEDISPRTAVLYPILLPDRLELLLSVGGRKHAVEVPVPAEEVTATTLAVVASLRPSSASGKAFAAEQAKRLYQWLIGPVTPLLDQHGIDTLIFVPDGVLRLMPVAALWDGEQYAIERYALVTAPGLSLVDPKPIPRQAMKTLLAGLSRPGPAVEKLPGSILRAAQQRAPSRNLRDMPVPPAAGENGTEAETLRDAGVYEAVKEALSLPGVRAEVAALSNQLPATVLLDDTFLRDRLEQEVVTSPYRIVHIASHGVFGGTPEASFIMTYDDLLDIRDLEGLLGRTAGGDRSVELVTLSACETAEGDDRSPLGLSGAVLKSGARSALGSLWSVYDDAVKLLIPEFYRQLANPGVSKAQALQRAQVKLLKIPEFSHPSYWSPFILIGNWL